MPDINFDRFAIDGKTDNSQSEDVKTAAAYNKEILELLITDIIAILKTYQKPSASINKIIDSWNLKLNNDIDKISEAQKNI